MDDIWSCRRLGGEFEYVNGGFIVASSLRFKQDFQVGILHRRMEPHLILCIV